MAEEQAGGAPDDSAPEASTSEDGEPHALQQALGVEERLDLLAVGTFLWDALDNLRRGARGVLSAARVRGFIQSQLQAVRRLFGRDQSRDLVALALVEETMLERFSLLFADYAQRQDAAESSLLRRILSRRETVGAACAVLGLLTLPLPVPTAVVCFFLGLIGYGVIGPALEQSRDVERDRLLTELGREQARIDLARSESDESLTSLPLIAVALRPMFDHLRAAGITDGAVYAAHAQRYVKWLQHRCPQRAEFLDAVAQAATERYAPAYAAAARRRQASERGGLLAKILANRWSTALLGAIVSIPLALISRRFTPLPTPVEVGLFLAVFAAVGSVAPQLWLPRPTELDNIARSFEQEQLLLEMHDQPADPAPRELPATLGRPGSGTATATEDKP